MKLTFDISATEFETARDILADIVPPGCRVWVFGSRAKNQTRFNSDLDLALECKDKLPRIISHKLKEAFSNSPLPYRVDVLDINDVSKEFQTIIRQQAIAFPLAKSNKVPKLRFPEFSGEWEQKKLGKIVKIERGRFSPRPRNDPKYYGGEIPFVQTSDVVKSMGKISAYSQTLNDLGLGVSKLFPKGSLLITIAANIGYAGVLERAMACPDSLIGLTCSKTLNNYFLNYILEIEQPKMDYLAVEAAQKNINIEFLKPYRIDFPTLPEQQKIASFLSAIDTKITQLTKKKTLLEYYKRGVMQKLFSQELRFKDAQGKAFPDWVEKRLGEFVSIRKGQQLNRDDMIQEGNFPVINGGISFSGFTDKMNAEGGIVTISEGGNSCGYVAWQNSDFWLGGHCYALSPSTNIVDRFLLQILKSLQKKIMRLRVGSGLPNIQKGDLNKLEIDLPYFDEQQKIAAFMSSIDTKIALVATELEHCQTFKKGLMQQMFI